MLSTHPSPRQPMNTAHTPPNQHRHSRASNRHSRAHSRHSRVGNRHSRVGGRFSGRNVHPEGRRRGVSPTRGEMSDRPVPHPERPTLFASAPLHPPPLRGRLRGGQQSEHVGRSYLLKTLILTALLITALALACGSNDGDVGDAPDESGTESESRIFARDFTLSSDDLTSLGLKSGKQYDVTNLPGAVANHVFYWRVDDVPIQYEARFYESHADATELGPEPAEEGSGEDAILDADDAVYKEGVRDRRTVFDFRGTPRPRYGAYAIYANTVILCEGRDDAEAWHRCTTLTQALDNR